MLGGYFGSYEHFTYSFGSLVGNHGWEGKNVLHVGVKGEGSPVFVEDGLRVGDPRIKSAHHNGSLAVLFLGNFLQGFLPGYSNGCTDWSSVKSSTNIANLTDS